MKKSVPNHWCILPQLRCAQWWLFLALAGNVVTVVSAERLRTAQTGRRNRTWDPDAAQGAVSGRRLHVADTDVASLLDDTTAPAAGRGKGVADFRLLPTLVSYAFYYKHADTNTCRSNLDFFIRHGVSEARDVKFVIHVIGDTPVPASLASLVANASNVQMHRVRNCGADLCTHGHFVQDMPAKEREGFGGFIFLNCGSRGPYHLKSFATSWYGRFREAMRGDLALVGPTISCERQKHVQSYAIGASPGVVDLLVRRWAQDDYIDYITVGELGLSQDVLEKGGRLTALGLDGCTYGHHNPFTCDHFVISTNTDERRLCRKRPTSLAAELEPSIECQACQWLEPTRVIFIKNGGSAERTNTRSPAVLARARYLEMSGLLTEFEPPVANGQDSGGVEPRSQHLEKAERKEHLGHFAEGLDRVARKPMLS